MQLLTHPLVCKNRQKCIYGNAFAMEVNGHSGGVLVVLYYIAYYFVLFIIILSCIFTSIYTCF